MAAEWLTRDATAMVLSQPNGALVNLARGKDEDGATVWREAEHPVGGAQPSQPLKGAEELTP